MLDLLAAATAFTAVIAVVAVVVTGLTVVPFVVSMSMAERRGFVATRWGTVALAGVGAGVVLAYALSKTGLPRPVALLPLVLCWLGPAALWLLDGSEDLIGGRPGRHE